MSKKRLHADDIYVGAHYRVRGEAHPKWILIVVTDRIRTLTSIRESRFSTDLGAAKPYFRNQLKRFCRETYGEDWQDSDQLILLAVR